MYRMREPDSPLCGVNSEAKVPQWIRPSERAGRGMAVPGPGVEGVPGLAIRRKLVCSCPYPLQGSQSMDMTPQAISMFLTAQKEDSKLQPTPVRVGIGSLLEMSKGPMDQESGFAASLL